MAFEDIIKKIKENTEQKIKEIELSLTEEKNKIISTVNQSIQKITENIQSETKTKIEQEKNRMASTANIELNKIILTEKKKLIDKAFSVAYQQFMNLSVADYEKLVKQQILSIIQTGNEEIFIPAKYYKHMAAKLLKEINTELRHKGMNSSVTIKEGNINSGFVLKSGKKEINATLDAIFDKYRKELEPEISEILFEND